MYKLEFNNDLNYSASGYWTSAWYETNADGLSLIWDEFEKTQSLTSGSIDYEFRFADLSDKSDAGSWLTSISGQTGKYIQARVSIEKIAEQNSPQVSSLTVTPNAVDQEGAKSVMIEEGSTNLLTYSEGDTSRYAQTGVTDANDIYPGLDGSLHFADNSATKYAYKSYSIQQNTTYTFSCFVKMDDNSEPVAGSSQTSGIDLGVVTNNTINTVSGDSILSGSYDVKYIGNNVYRVSKTFEVGGTITSTNIGVIKYNTQSPKGFKVTGYQLEQKSYPTSYIKTTSAAVTRNSDVLAIPTGSINLTNGSVIIRTYIEGDLLVGGTNSSHGLFAAVNGSSISSNTIYLNRRGSDGLIEFAVRDSSGSYKAAYVTNENIAQGWHTFGIKWSQDGLALYLDGTQLATGSVSTFPSAISNVYIGTLPTGKEWNTQIADVDIFHEALTDAEMAAYTSTSGVIALTEKHSYKLNFNQADFSHSEGGYRIAPALDIDHLGTLSGSEISWSETMPASSQIITETSIDNGITWNPAVSATAVSGLVADAAASGKIVLVKQKFLSTGGTPSVQDVTVKIGQKQTEKNTYIKPVANKLEIIPTNLDKWQLENKKYTTSFIDGTRQADVLSVASGEIFDPAEGSFIARVYSNRDPQENLQFVVDFAGTGTSGMYLTLDTTGVFKSFIGGSTSRTLTGATTIEKDTWHTVGLRWNAATCALYVDGNMEASGSVSQSVVPYANLYIGSNNGVLRFFDGQFDEVHLFGEALTDAEMEEYTQASGSVTTMTDKHTYRLKFNGDMTYGATGTWTSRWLDAGENCIDSSWLELKTVETVPSGTEINYKFRCSNTGSDGDATDWYDDITDENLLGRYIQVKAFLSTEDDAVSPSVSYIEPISRYS